MVLFDRTLRALEDLLSSASSSILSSVSGIALATLGSTLMLGSKHLAARWLASSIALAPVAIDSFSLDALFQTESFERALIGAIPPTSNGIQFWTRLLLCGAIHGTGEIVLGSGVAKFLSHEASNSGIRNAFPSTHVLVPGVIAYRWLDALQKDTERGEDRGKKTHQTPSVGGSANEDGCEDETPTIASGRGPNHDDSVGAEQVPTCTNRDENNSNNSNDPGAPNHPTLVKQAVDGHAVSELDSRTTSNDETVSVCSASVSSGTSGVASVGSNGNSAVVGGSDENGPGVTRASPPPTASPNDEDWIDRTATPGLEDAADPQ